MKQTITFECQNCRTRIKIDNKEDFEKELNNHKEKCNGELKMLNGVCFEEAMHNLIIEPRLTFCYRYFTDDTINQKCIHCWNEFQGYFNEKGFNFSNIIGDTYVLDTSDKETPITILRKEYYQYKNINEKKVYRLNLKEFLVKILDSIDKGKDYREGWE